MDVWDPEGNADYLYQLAGADADDPPGVVALARAVLGRDAVELVPSRAVPRDAALARVGDRWRIYARRGLPVERLTFAVAHELAEWVYRGTADEYLEQACDALAGALVVPRPAFVRLVHEYSDLRAAFEMAAEAFVTTPSCVAMRLGEATGRPVAVVAPGSVRVRGEAWDWPPAPAIRKLARQPAPGVERVQLAGRGRVALVVG